MTPPCPVVTFSLPSCRMRFFYDGQWTRWFGNDDDLRFLRDIPSVEKMEVREILANSTRGEP